MFVRKISINDDSLMIYNY